MDYGDFALFNDEQRARLNAATRKAAQGWRFRRFKRPGARLLSATVQAVGDLAQDVLEAARRKDKRAHPRRPLTLTEQR